MSSDEECCQRCGEAGEDRRSLWMACFYEMNELRIPFHRSVVMDESFYTLRVCKGCRGDWLAAIKAWFESRPSRKPTGTGVFVRRYGATVEATEEEVEQMRNRGQTVYRVKDGP